MTAATLFLALAALSVDQDSEPMPLDVLVEYRIPPGRPWQELGGKAIPLPELDDSRQHIIYRSALLPRNFAAFLRSERTMCPAAELVPPTGFCVRAVHANPPMDFGGGGYAGECREPSGGGGLAELRSDLRADAVQKMSEGNGVLIAVVDTAMDAVYIHSYTGAAFDPDYSYSCDGVSPGHGSWESHGTMAGFLATVLASKATLASISSEAFFTERLGAFVRGMNHLIEKHRKRPKYDAIVVNNSWAVGDADFEGPPGTCSGTTPRGGPDVVEADEPCHVVNRLLDTLTSEPLNFDVIFSAGNSGRCQPSNESSISGPALHEKVLTVAAVDFEKRRLYDSGQGTHANKKPNVSAPTHYTATRAGEIDTQTSAATAVVSGLVAAMRSCTNKPGATGSAKREHVFTTIMATADKSVRASATGAGQGPQQITAPHPDFGAGVIAPATAVSAACR